MRTTILSRRKLTFISDKSLKNIPSSLIWRRKSGGWVAQNFIENQPRELWVKASHLGISESAGQFLPKAVKCLVSPIESKRRLSTTSEIEISDTSEVPMQRFFTLAIVRRVDELRGGKPRNCQQGGRAWFDQGKAEITAGSGWY